MSWKKTLCTNKTWNRLDKKHQKTVDDVIIVKSHEKENNNYTHDVNSCIINQGDTIRSYIAFAVKLLYVAI